MARSSPEVRLRRGVRGGNPAPSIGYVEAVEAALCFGWIDGKVQKSDSEGWYRQRFTPRRARSTRPETRARRIAKFVGQLERGETPG